MHRILVFICTLTAAAVVVFVQAHRPVDQQDRLAVLAIRHVTVVDVTGIPARADQTVILEGSRIRHVGPAASVAIPGDALVVDAGGRWLMPGLWDMHVHSGWPSRDRALYLANGITAVRDMGGAASDNPPRDPSPFSAPWSILRPFRDDEQMPMVVAAGVMLDGPDPSPGALKVRTREAARAAIEALATERVDFIKVGTGITREQYAAIAHEAKRLGLMVAGHVPRGMTALEVAEAGQRSIEHLMGLPSDCFADTEPGEACLTALTHLHDRGVWQVPTLTAWHNKLLRTSPSVRSQSELRYVRDLAAGWERDTEGQSHRQPNDRPDSGQRTFEQFLRVTGTMRRVHVRLLAGTDAGNPYTVPGFSLHDELRWLVAAGHSPLEALAAATVEPARFLRLEADLGSVEPGKIANLVLLNGDPLADVANAARVEAVILRGALLNRRALDQMLDRAERAQR